MTELVLRGLVLRTADYKESSRMLTVLTDRLGKLSVSARGAVRGKSRYAAACQPFAFSELTLSESKDRYYLKEAATLELFSGLADRLEDYALGSYFLELLDAACPETAEEPEALSLGLNALWLLAEGKKDRALVKSAFELRLMSILGYRPETARCAVCGAEVPVSPLLDLRGGALYCRNCGQSLVQRPFALDAGSLAALRHITSAESSRVFSFTVAKEAGKRLGQAAERYVREQMERDFRTLEYYKSL